MCVSVVSTAKVQKIWEQFTTYRESTWNVDKLFRLQKYKKFESNSQPKSWWTNWKVVVSTAKVQKIWEQFTTRDSQLLKNLLVVSTAKVQKIWEQFTTGYFTWSNFKSCFDCKSTKNLRAIHNENWTESRDIKLFRLQKYKKFESNSQRFLLLSWKSICCFDCKSTKNLRAIHNTLTSSVISSTLFRLQKYKKFESNSQPPASSPSGIAGCFDCKSTKNLRAIHNYRWIWLFHQHVVSTAKVQKIWEQFTTLPASSERISALFRLQKYKKFESNSQRHSDIWWQACCCFDCKSTKNLRAIHNYSSRRATTEMLFRLQKYKKFESNSQRLTNSRRKPLVVSTAKVQKIWEQFTTFPIWM